MAQELQKEKNSLNDFIIIIKNLEIEVRNIRQQIYEKELEKEKIIANYQKALRDYEITVPIISESHLIKLKKDLE